MAGVTVRTEELAFLREGTTIRGFGAWPVRHERLPALILLPDVRGVSDFYREAAVRFAREGFWTLALDPYSRGGPPELPSLESALAWMETLDDRQILDDVAAAVRFVGSRIDVRPSAIGVTGFCMGGQYALLAAGSVPGLAACVSFYGMLRYARKAPHRPREPLEAVSSLSCPFLGLFGADDPLIPKTEVTELRKRLPASGQVHEVKVYAGAGHAFLHTGRPDAYRPVAAKDAWQRAVRFLRAHLAPLGPS